MFKKFFLMSAILLLFACGSPVVNKQSGMAETQSIYIVADTLVGYSVSFAALNDYKVSSSDLMSHSLKIATSVNSDFQKSEVLEIKAPQGENQLRVKNSTGEVIYQKMIYLSKGQTTTIKL